MQDEWRTIFEFPLYEMNNEGLVRKKGNGDTLTVSHDQHGFPYIRMRDHETSTQVSRGVDKLLRTTFPELALPNRFIRRPKS